MWHFSPIEIYEVIKSRVQKPSKELKICFAQI